MSEQRADSDDGGEPTDGRVARRERNIAAVVDVVLEMFAEESMFPTIEQAATRSGLSLRSLYRYFADPAELLEAAIKRSRERAREISRLDALGQGPLLDRIDRFVASRIRVYETLGPEYRATVANAAKHPRVRDELTRSRDELRIQFELQFAPELAAAEPSERTRKLAAGDVLTQLDSLDYLRQHRGLSVTELEAVLTASLRSALA